jgi:hypothetical protein
MGREGYGGIWLTGKPFQLNVKCLIIGLIVACIYALPKQAGAGNMFMMAFIFCMTYIGISIYDMLYRCQAHLLSGAHSTTGIFKPQDTNYDKSPRPPEINLARNQELAYRSAVYTTHATVIAPIVIVSSFLAMRERRRRFDATGVSAENRSYGIFPVSMGLGLLALFYHSARMIWPRDACKFPQQNPGATMPL